ncbi:MAG: amino acid ABC transporter substrate-binding protein [Lachnospiraceae bacterium]|nr:amino acid ABC transporter substrate-binding protein [Lachnospiraceae bacterium]
MDKRGLKRILSLIIAVSLCLGLVGCGGTGSDDQAAKDDSLQAVLDSGQLVLGLDADFPPMGFTGKTGKIVGFDIDVAREVCKRMGVELVCRPIKWDEKEEELNSGEIDCIWNGMSVTRDRELAMTLSDPYMKNELIFVVTDKSDAKATWDLVGRKVGVQAGSTAEETLRESDLFGQVTMVPLDSNMKLIDKVLDGTLDAILVDSVVAYYYVFLSDEKFYVLPESLHEEEYAIGFRKGDMALRDKVQQTLSDMKADGTLNFISTEWFGCDITTVR